MSDPRICMIHPHPSSVAETFIEIQGRRLPNVVAVLHGGHMPTHENRESTPCAELLHSTESIFSPTGTPETALHEDAVERLTNYLIKRKVDVVLAQYGPTGVALLEPCKRAGIPLVTHFHGFDASLKPVIEKYRTGYDRLFREGTAFIAVSLVMEQMLKALGAPADRLVVNPYGVDHARFSGGDPANSKPVFLGVGRFVEKKAPQTTIRAFAGVVREVPEARLVLAGDGELRDECMLLATELGMATNVDFPGRVTHDEVADLMRQARAYVQHSVTASTGDMEGTPNSILEASASGLPVVSTIHAGIPQSVIHGETGLLCEEHDVIAMERNMLLLATSPEKAAAMGNAGQHHVAKEYDLNDRLGRLHQIIKQAAKA